jgi:hypothetical protein
VMANLLQSERRWSAVDLASPSPTRPLCWAAKYRCVWFAGPQAEFARYSALVTAVQVDWEGEGIFTGTVKAYHPNRKITVPWKIAYEDGDKEYGRFDSNLDILYIYNGQRRVKWLDGTPVWDDLFIGGAVPDAGATALAPPNHDDSKRSALSASSSPGFPSRPESQVSTPSHSQQQAAPPALDGHAAAKLQDSVPSSAAPAAPAAAAAAAVPLQKAQQVVQQATANLPRQPKEPPVPAVQNPRLPSLQPVVKRSSQAPPPNRPHSFVKTPQSNILKRKQPGMPNHSAKPSGAASHLTAARKVEPAHLAKRPSFGHPAASAPKQPGDSKANGAPTPHQPGSASLPSTASAPAAAATAAAATGMPSAAVAAAAAMVANRGAATACAAPILKVTDFSQAGSKARSTAMESSTRLAKFSNSLQELQGTTSRSKIASVAEEGLSCARDMGASKVMRIILERLKSEDNTSKNCAVCFVLDNMMYRYHKEGAGPDSWMPAAAKDLISKVCVCSPAVPAVEHAQWASVPLLPAPLPCAVPLPRASRRQPCSHPCCPRRARGACCARLSSACCACCAGGRLLPGPNERRRAQQRRLRPAAEALCVVAQAGHLHRVRLPARVRDRARQGMPVAPRAVVAPDACAPLK